MENKVVKGVLIVAGIAASVAAAGVLVRKYVPDFLLPDWTGTSEAVDVDEEAVDVLWSSIDDDEEDTTETESTDEEESKEE